MYVNVQGSSKGVHHECPRSNKWHIVQWWRGVRHQKPQARRTAGWRNFFRRSTARIFFAALHAFISQQVSSIAGVCCGLLALTRIVCDGCDEGVGGISMYTLSPCLSSCSSGDPPRYCCLSLSVEPNAVVYQPWPTVSTTSCCSPWCVTDLVARPRSRAHHQCNGSTSSSLPM